MDFLLNLIRGKKLRADIEQEDEFVDAVEELNLKVESADNTFVDTKCCEIKNKVLQPQLEMPIKKLNDFRQKYPECVLSNEQKLPGVIVNDRDGVLYVDFNKNVFEIDKKTIKMKCLYEVGDRVYVTCNVEADELFCGNHKEKINIVSIKPKFKRKNQKCVVREIHGDHIALDNNCFIGKSLLERIDMEVIEVGDILQADMIENERKNFKWRCVNFVSLNGKENVNPFTELKKDSKRRNGYESKIRLLPPNVSGHFRNFEMELCEYANQVFTHKLGEIVSPNNKSSNRRFKFNRMPFCEVPLDLKNIFFKKYKEPHAFQNELEKKYSSLKEPLSYENYFDRFQNLLWLEEIEIFKNFRRYDQPRAKFTRESDFLALTITDLAERRPSLMIGDKVRAYPLQEMSSFESSDSASPEDKSVSICYVGYITSIFADRILINFHSVFSEAYNNESFRLEFYFSRTGLRRKHYAIQQIVKKFPKDFIFPTEVRLRSCPQLDVHFNAESANIQTVEDTIKWYNPNLNQLQRFAVFNVLRGEAENLPYIIYGPPGTGKTITLIETILQLVSNLPQSRLLVATPSNSAANLICSRLIESKGLHVGEMVRLVSYNSIEKDQIPEDILSYCVTADMGIDGTHEDGMFTTADGIQMNCSTSMLAQARVTVGTCMSLGQYLELGFSANHFTHVLIDEAGQCSEPAASLVISQVSKLQSQIVLAGDPMQLQAVITCKYAGARGLSMSLLERLLGTSPYRMDPFEYAENSGYNPVLVTKLLLNYRSLPSLLRIYNYLFYKMELKADVKAINSREANLLKKIEKKVLFKSTKRPESHGVYFYVVRGENIRERDSPSWCNPREANVVFNTTLSLYRAGLKPENIGIITPYARQVKFIRNLFVEAKLKAPKIGSVEEFQGQERDVILLSTVRTTRRDLQTYDWRYSLGFVKCERRLNVAISRARALVIVFGNPDLLQLDQCWGVYISDCRSNDSFYGLSDANDNNENSDSTDSGE